jgi:hypothetical protein
LTRKQKTRLVLLVVNVPPTESLAAHIVADHQTDHLLLVAPVLLGKLRFWTSDVDWARKEANERLARWVDALAAAGAAARVYVGADDPLQVIEDAVAITPCDEVVVTVPTSDHWQVRDLTRRLRERVGIPVDELRAA